MIAETLYYVACAGLSAIGVALLPLDPAAGAVALTAGPIIGAAHYWLAQRPRT